MQTPERQLTETRMFYSRLPDTAGFTMVFTPLIDLFFILLVFITLGSEVVYSWGVGIDPPIVDNAKYLRANKLVIALKAIRDDTQTYVNTQVYFNDQTVSDYNKLENELKAIIGSRNMGNTSDTTSDVDNPRLVVMLRADNDVPVNDIAQVMSICRKNKVKLFITTKQR